MAWTYIKREDSHIAPPPDGTVAYLFVFSDGAIERSILGFLPESATEEEIDTVVDTLRSQLDNGEL